MHEPSSHLAPSPAPRDALADAYHAAARAHIASLKSDSKLEIFIAFRAVLVAEMALLRDSGGALDLATAEASERELVDLDLDIANLEGALSASFAR